MKITIDLDEHQIKLLELILLQIRPNPLIVAPSVKPKKLSKTELALQNITEYELKKQLRKRR